MYFNGFANGGILLALGFVATVSAMILWFRDVVAEGTLLGNHTFAVQKGLNLGVALFIVSEIFFFISIFWAWDVPVKFSYMQERSTALPLLVFSPFARLK